MNKYEEVAKAKYTRVFQDERLLGVLIKTLENVAAERAGFDAPYDDKEIYSQIKEIKDEMNRSVFEISDEAALVAVDLFEEWCVKFYSKGQRVVENGVLYKAKQDVEANVSWKPSETPALWEPISNPEESGTIENPISAATGMTYYKDMYYKQNGKIYLCIRQDTDSGTALYHSLADLVGLYFEEVSN